MKKLLYIGHSYHAKTQSTKFLLDMFREHYDVTLVLDESWNGEEPIDTNVITPEYDAVVFFQQILAGDVFKTISHPNMIFFPMYDCVAGWSLDEWNAYKNIKIFNFSKTIHERLVAWGFNSKHLQYFIKPKEYVEQTNSDVFFWQRITSININTVSALFEKYDVNIHMHKGIDPYQEYIEPSGEQELKHNITYSSWFDTKEELQECIQSKTFYIAPRIAEGIGMSFLEAMAMGKVVIAYNDATMNEYIEHGKTGYLFDYNDPQPVDFGDIEAIRMLTYDYIKTGYENWEENKKQIIDWIEAKPRYSLRLKINKFISLFFNIRESENTIRIRVFGIQILKINKGTNDAEK